MDNTDISKDDTVYTPGYSVTDRRGTGAGWNLTLTLGDFVEQNVASDDTEHTLKGAQLSFPEITPNTTKDASHSVAPTSFAKTFDAGGTAKVLMSAAKDQGMGLWEARYNSRALELSDGSTTEKNRFNYLFQEIIMQVNIKQHLHGTYQTHQLHQLLNKREYKKERV